MPHWDERIRGERLAVLMSEAPSIRLLDDAVLVKIDKPERMSASKKLILPDNAKRQPHELYQATVLATGPGALRTKDGKRNPMEVQFGDTVLVYWASMELEVTELFSKDGSEMRVISEKSIQMAWSS